MTDLTRPGPSPLALSDLERTAAAAAELSKENLSPATRRAYATDWANFQGWCAEGGLTPLPADPRVVALYLTRLVEEGLRCSSIERALTGITHFQHLQDRSWARGAPEIADVFRGIRRTLGVKHEKKTVIDDVRLREIVTRRPPTIAGTLEKAVLLLGWSTALRRSNIVDLDVEDVDFTPKGLDVFVRKSKTDQSGKGRHVGVAPAKDPVLCAARALDAWLTVSHRRVAGPLFLLVDGRSGELTDKRLRPKHVGDIVKRAVADVGLDPETFAGHSLRRGFATTAAGAGVSIDAIQRQTGHASLKILVEDYIKPATIFLSNATKGLL